MKYVKRMIFSLIYNYLPNNIINGIPFYCVRNLYYKKVLKIYIGEGSSIHLKVRINSQEVMKNRINIGANSVINRECYIDGRGGIDIGKNVSISPNVKIITASHDMNSSDFKYIKAPIKIEDYVWIGTGAMILPGVTLKRGAVVAAGAVVSKDVEELNVVGGIPAKKISVRKDDFNYKCNWKPFFD